MTTRRRLLPLPARLVLAPVSRWPTTLPDESVRVVLGASVSERVERRPAGPAPPDISIVTVTWNGLIFTSICLESLLASRSATTFEALVVDNGSTDGTGDHLAEVELLD